MTGEVHVNEREITPHDEHPAAEERSTSRRQLLLAAGAGAGAAAVASVVGEAAQAANGDPLLVGNTANAATAATKLTSSGTVNAPGLQVQALNYDTGVEGDGVYGVTGIGAGGGFFSGTEAAVSLDPMGSPGAPTGTAFKGDLAVDSNGVLFLCIAAGAPGTWIRLSSVNLLSTPQRLYDSRNTGGKFASGETRNLDVAGVLAGVPAYATGIIGNATVVDTGGAGFIVIYPKGTSRPGTASNTWFGAAQILANAFTVGLAGSPGGIAVYAEATVTPATHVVIDVFGYVA